MTNNSPASLRSFPNSLIPLLVNLINYPMLFASSFILRWASAQLMRKNFTPWAEAHPFHVGTTTMCAIVFMHVLLLRLHVQCKRGSKLRKMPCISMHSFQVCNLILKKEILQRDGEISIGYEPSSGNFSLIFANNYQYDEYENAALFFRFLTDSQMVLTVSFDSNWLLIVGFPPFSS